MEILRQLLIKRLSFIYYIITFLNVILLKYTKKPYNINMEYENSSDFESAADIIKSLNLNYDYDYESKIAEFFSFWAKITTSQIAKFSKPIKLTDKGILIIKCENSVVANEIFNSRTKYNAALEKEAKNIGLSFFKYIKITYK